MKNILGLILLAGIGYLVYSFFFQSSKTREGTTEAKICEVRDNPRKYAQFKEVKLNGTVAGSNSLAGYNLIELKQESTDCTINVISEGPSPSEGKQITVSGLVKEAYKVGDSRKLVVVE